jgi:hypothetical protein
MTPGQVLTELGRTGLVQYSGEIAEQPLRKLQGSKARKIWTEMYRYDDMVGMAMRAIQLLIRGVPWREEPFSEEPQHVEDAEWLGTMKDDMSHSWGDFMAQTTTALPYGFAPFEIVLKWRQGEKAEPGESSRYNDGKLGIRKLPIRSQDSILRWIFDDEGGIQGLVQSVEGAAPVEIPIEKLLLFRTDPYKGNPEGRSILENAYIAWFAKKRVQEYEWIRVERDATGVPTIYAPAELLDAEATSADKALLTALKKIVRDLKFNEQAGIIMPSMRDEDGNELYRLELLSSPGTRPMQTGPILDRLNRAIVMSMLADVLMLGHEKVGSYALASSKTNLFATAIGAYLDATEDVLNRHLVPRLFRWNGMQTSELPQFKHGDIEAQDLSEMAAFLKEISQAGGAIFPNRDLENYLLEQAGLPTMPEEGEGGEIEPVEVEPEE